MKLVIVESPTKAKTLSKILPKKEYKVEASKGHIRDLPKSGLGVDVEKTFLPEYTIPEKAKKTITKLKKAAKEADTIVLATDPDREGEAIAWHLVEILQPKRGKKKEFTRAVFHELTKNAVLDSFEHMGTLDEDLVDAQQARRVLDRLVGYKLSPLLWKKVMFGLSAGRVQSVAVRLIVERERERDAFKPEEYWSIDGFFKGKKEEFKAALSSKNGKKLEIKNGKESEKITKELEKDNFQISEIKKSERKKKPQAPYKTSTLQQNMSNLFGFNARRTMKAAQGLFEKGYITYHRTDSTNLSKEFVASARSFIKKQLGDEFLPKEAPVYAKKTKNAQEAHEAIRPADLSKEPGKGLKEDELKVYSMIWKRSLECQMMPAIYDQTTMIVAGDSGYEFRATGSIIKFEGFYAAGKLIGLAVNGVEKPETLPDLPEGTNVTLEKLDPVQHFTQPPGRFSDATLIKTMEEMGIGRPSTYAPTLTTIKSRGYVEKDGRYFKPRDVAFVVSDILVKHFPEIVDYGFTAEMEEDLDEIAEGKKEWVPVIKEFYKPFEKKLKVKDKELDKHTITNLGESDEKCPECGKVLIYKLGKYGKFLSCSGYPECKFAKPIDGPSDEELNADYGKCPNCEDGNFVLKTGRFGKFLACSNYPKCKTTKPYLDKIGMKCPKCKDGEIIIKKAKGRNFFGCSNYPDCDYSSWKDPRGPAKEEDEPVESIA